MKRKRLCVFWHRWRIKVIHRLRDTRIVRICQRCGVAEVRREA